MNKLYYGDNLEVLKRHIADESVDLVYLDPPFNSKQNFNILFKSPKGDLSEAQVNAFKDTWHWNLQSQTEFEEIMASPYTNLVEVMRSLRRILQDTDSMAYLTMMARRLMELHRVLKPTGTLYLHCDPTASHYLKLVLDGIFLMENFSNEIIWQRTTTKNDYKQGAVNLPRVHDVIFMYQKNARNKPTFNQLFTDYKTSYLQKTYRYQDEDGRPYQLSDLAAPGRGTRGHPEYEFLGVKRYWRYSKEKMEQLLADGRIIQKKPGAVPRYKRYLDEMEGVAINDVWVDIPPVQGQSKEFLGYPTQKPLRLLERIIEISSKEGDVILDPFCGCGTAVHAADRLNRQWIGIDITHLAITLIEQRLKQARPDSIFEVEGRPKDIAGARDLAQRDKYQFQWWACSLVKAQPRQGQKKGPDKGIDGLIYFTDVVNNKPETRKIIISVKGGENTSIAMLRELITVVKQQEADLGFFVTLTPPTSGMLSEAAKEGFYLGMNGQKSYPRIQILTIEGLLDGTNKPEYIDFSRGTETYKSAAVDKITGQQNELF